MDKKEAIVLLIASLGEIPSLKKLNYDNQKFKLWRNGVETIIKYGLDEDDYDTFGSVQPLDFLDDIGIENIEQSLDYPKTLKDYETALKSIIQKHQILRMEAEPSIKGGIPKATEDYEEKAATKELELFLEGSPDMILECIRSTTENLNSQGYTYSFRRTSDAPDYAKWDKTYFASCAISQGDEGQIGTIKLRLLPQERTLLKYPEPKDFDSSFGRFLNRLFAEFKRLGYVDFKEEKPATMAERFPKAFIAHEGETEQLKKLKDFLEALGIKYLIAESQASNGRSIERQVDWTMGKADFAICLATKGKAINKKTRKHYMGLNVAEELGRARKVFGNKIILLAQKGVEVQTNTREIVYATFTTQSMDIAFTKVVKELRNWGFIRVEK